MTKSSWRPYVVLAIGLAAVSSSAILIRFAQADGAPSLVISAWRLGLATLILTPIVIAKYRTQLAQLDRTAIGLLVLSGVLLGVHFASWITSLEYTSVTSSVVLVSTSPLWVVLAVPVFLKERWTRLILITVLIAVAGAVVISLTGNAGTAPRQDSPMFGNGLAVIGAIAIAGNYMIGRRVRATLDVIPYSWLTYAIAAIVVMVAVVITRQPVTGLAPSAYFWMTLVGLIPQLIGHSAYNYALGYLSAAYVSLTILVEPIGSAILAAMFLAEQPTGGQIVGGAVVLFGLVLASREESRSVRQVEQEAAITELTGM